MHERLTWLCCILFLFYKMAITSEEIRECDGSCCANYILQGKDCVPCENGTYGVNCTQRCEKYYYGMFCLDRCDCNGTDCDPRTGRCYYDSTLYITVGDGIHKMFGISKPLVTSLLVAGSMIVFIGITGCTMVIKRRNPSGNNYTNLLGLVELLSRSPQSSPIQDDDNNRNSVSNSHYNSDHESDAIGAYHFIDSNAIIDSSTLETGKQDSSNCNLSSIAPTAGTYHTASDAYCTLTRPGKAPTAEVPKSSSILNRAITDWNNEKPEDYVRVRKWQELQKGEKIPNVNHKAEKRRKSKTISYIRRGIYSIFRNSKSDLDRERKDDVNTSNPNRYSLVKTELQFTQDNRQSSEALPPPPDEWYVETKLPVSESEGSQGSLTNLNDEIQENSLQSATAVPQPEATDDKKHGNRKFTLQKCHITQGATIL